MANNPKNDAQNNNSKSYNNMNLCYLKTYQGEENTFKNNNLIFNVNPSILLHNKTI